MKKRDYLIKLLTKLQDDWPIAQGLLLVLQNTKQDDAMVDTLMNVFANAMKNTKTQLSHKKLQQTKAVMEKYKQIESQEQQKELKELDALLDEL